MDDTDPSATRAALRGLCCRVSANLRISLGDDGYAAVLRRALARAQQAHPVLNGLAPDAQSTFDLAGIVDGADPQNAPLFAAAVESLLAAVIDTLSGLIGPDMTVSLLGHDSLQPPERRTNNDHA